MDKNNKFQKLSMKDVSYSDLCDMSDEEFENLDYSDGVVLQRRYHPSKLSKIVRPINYFTGTYYPGFITSYELVRKSGDEDPNLIKKSWDWFINKSPNI